MSSAEKPLSSVSAVVGTGKREKRQLSALNKQDCSHHDAHDHVSITATIKGLNGLVNKTLATKQGIHFRLSYDAVTLKCDHAHQNRHGSVKDGDYRPITL